ncbi:MAG: 3-dehydroquinate synthase [Deltaproteobacteria bacterium]|nr:3-dehydroquinate synthase [Deltaproteobacteria bacterium]
MRTINVELGNRSYPIVIKRGLLDEVGPRIASLGLKGKAAIITNPLVGGLYAQRLTKTLKDAGLNPVIITVPDGEEYKSLQEASSIFDGLIEHRMERSNPIIALGGGVIGDMAGFIAATYLRGVPYIQVPTTLLSQVDSSVGGKTAVNHPKGKNLIGAFYQPKAVFIDPDVLETLEPREVRAGLAEIIKYGVIWDEPFFKFLENNTDSLLSRKDELIDAIEKSCSIKAEVVGSDETEQGIRAILNFGHTFGHAIEALSGYGKYKHGEAVAIGMVMASELSESLGLSGRQTTERIKALVTALDLPADPPKLSADQWIGSMLLDKKVSGSRMRFVLAEHIGKVIIKEVSEEELRKYFDSKAIK